MFAWTVLGLVFLDEVLAAVAVGVWGGSSHGWMGATLAPIAFVAAWWAVASPKARWGGTLIRPAVKTIAFALASLGLWAAGHHAAAIALLTFSVVINAAAQLPSVQRALAVEAR